MIKQNLNGLSGAKGDILFQELKVLALSGDRKIGTEALGELYPSTLNADTCTK